MFKKDDIVQVKYKNDEKWTYKILDTTFNQGTYEVVCIDCPSKKWIGRQFTEYFSPTLFPKLLNGPNKGHTLTKIFA